MEARGRLPMPLTPREAAALQERLRGRVIRRGAPRHGIVAGVDVSEKDGTARAAIVVTRHLEPIEEVTREAIQLPRDQSMRNWSAGRFLV